MSFPDYLETLYNTIAGAYFSYMQIIPYSDMQRIANINVVMMFKQGNDLDQEVYYTVKLRLSCFGDP